MLALRRAVLLAITALSALFHLASGDARAGTLYEVYTDRSAFEARVIAWEEIDFDDIPTSGSEFVAFEADRYASLGVRIEGATGGGQYVSRDFLFPADFVPSSSPNVYAPGPIADQTGTNTTTIVTFDNGAGSQSVVGFGCVFIDADYPQYGPSTLQAFDSNGSFLADVGVVSGANASQLFRGIVAVDAETDLPVPAIARVEIVSGSEWPSVDVNEGVVLDDFVVAPLPEPAGSGLAAAAVTGLVLCARRRLAIRAGRSLHGSSSEASRLCRVRV